MVLRKQIAGLSHARSCCTSVHEVEIVLEDLVGRLVGIEVKVTTVRDADIRRLRTFRDLVGARFQRRVVFYTGAESVPLGDDLCAIPISTLWRTNGTSVSTKF